MAFYFKENVFYPKGKRLSGSKMFTSLPAHTKLMVTPYNLYSMARVVPISMLASSIQGTPLNFNLSTNIKVGFWDIETTPQEKFTYAVLNGEEYHDPDEFLQDLVKYPVRFAHNSFRFDLPVLFNNVKDKRLFGLYGLNKFKLYYLKRGIDIDLLFIARLCNFGNLSLYGIARTLDIPFTTYDTYNLEKCRQDVEMLQEIYRAINIPQICTLIDKLVSVDLNLLQNVWFDRFLRYVILQQYLNEGYLPTAYPHKSADEDVTLPANVPLKVGKRGEYRNLVYYYDVTNAYPYTAIHNKLSVYLGEEVIPHLEEILTKLMKDTVGEQRGMLKKLSVAIIGYMNDKNNYFSNPMVWFNTVTNFDRVIKTVVRDKPIIWANTDGFMIQEPLPNIKLDPYDLGLKDVFIYLKIYHANKYLGVSSYDYSVTMKGFKRPKFEGIRLMQKRLRELLGVPLATVESALKVLTPYTQELLKVPNLWTTTIRKTSDECRNLDYLEYWEDLENGFNTLTLKVKDRKDKLLRWLKQF